MSSNKLGRRRDLANLAIRCAVDQDLVVWRSAWLISDRASSSRSNSRCRHGYDSRGTTFAFAGRANSRGHSTKQPPMRPVTVAVARWQPNHRAGA